MKWDYLYFEEVLIKNSIMFLEQSKCFLKYNIKVKKEIKVENSQ